MDIVGDAYLRWVDTKRLIFESSDILQDESQSERRHNVYQSFDDIDFSDPNMKNELLVLFLYDFFSDDISNPEETDTYEILSNIYDNNVMVYHDLNNKETDILIPQPLKRKLFRGFLARSSHAGVQPPFNYDAVEDFFNNLDMLVHEYKSKNTNVEKQFTKGNILNHIRNRYKYADYDEEGYDKILRHHDFKMTATQPIDMPITMDELLNAINIQKNNNTMGIDHIPASIYFVVNDKIRREMLLLFNLFLEYKHIPVDFKIGIAKIINKPGLKSDYLKDTRIINILNADYKIFTIILRERLKNYVDQEINIFQTALLSEETGRHVLNNTSLLDLVINILPYDGDVVRMDFKSAYDNIPHEMLLTIARRTSVSGLGDIISALYNDILLTYTYDNDDSYNLIRQERGIRLGDPLSNILFLLVMDVFIGFFRQNHLDDGVILPENLETNVKVNIIPYSDDFVLVSTTENEMKRYLRTIEKFLDITGFEINDKKTTSLRKSQNQPVPFNYLGAYFDMYGIIPNRSASLLDDFIRNIHILPDEVINDGQYEHLTQFFYSFLNKIKGIINNEPLSKETKYVDKFFRDTFSYKVVRKYMRIRERSEYQKLAVLRNIYNLSIRHGYPAIMRALLQLSDNIDQYGEIAKTFEILGKKHHMLTFEHMQ